jgi:Heparinase II/III N-terminus/Heparinase II/III-like protein
MGKSKLLKLGSKILKGEFSELIFRGKEALGKISEKRKVSTGRQDFSKNNLEELLIDPAILKFGLAKSFKDRSSPKFFRFPLKLSEIEKMTHKYPEEIQKIIKISEEILRDKYPVFGGKCLDFGSPPDWFFDPQAEIKSQLYFYDDIDYLNYESVGDSKVVWELSRLKFIYPLGQAYHFTGNDNYALKAFGMIEDWFKCNPPKRGINWSSSLECAFRIYALIWMIEYFRDIELLDNRFAEMVWYNVYQMADHIERHLSYYFSPNTHLTGEAFGLFVTGLIFPEFKRANHFMTLGLKILSQELERQFTSEGIHAELSSYYHRYSTEFYLHTIILSDLNSISLDPDFIEKTRQMVEYMRRLKRPDGLWPQCGDSDGGKLTWLEFDDVRDYSAVLSTAANIFETPGLFKGKSRYETSWLVEEFKESSEDKTEISLNTNKSIYYPEAGYAILKSENHEIYMLFDCGKFGYRDSAHSHADSLSFELVFGNQPIFIDPGTYCYTKDLKMRNYFRSAAAHNVCLVDGEGVSDTADTFSWESTADVTVKNVAFSDHFDFISAAVNRVKKPAFTHTRNIFRIGNEYCIIYDEIGQITDAKVRWLFHTPFSSHTLSAKSNLISLENADQIVHLKPLIDTDYSLKAASGQKEPASGWYSPDYGVLEKITTLMIEPESSGCLRVPFCIMPFQGKKKKHNFKEFETGRWSICFEDYDDSWQFEEDGKLSYVRTDKDGNLMAFFIMNRDNLSTGSEKIWESGMTSHLIGRIEGKTLCLYGEISGNCKLYKTDIENVSIGDRFIKTSIVGNFTEFEI